MTVRDLQPPLAPGLFDLEPGQSWIMHCAEGPVPLSAAEAARDLLGRETKPWKMRWEEDFIGLPEAVRRESAALFGGAAEDYSLVSTTTAGLVAIAQGWAWDVGDEIVIPRGEFPTNAYPWATLAARGVRLTEVPLWDGHEAGTRALDSAPPPAELAGQSPGGSPEERLLAALGPKTRFLSVSWVRFQDGLRLDLERLARGCDEHGAMLIVDGIQGAGTLPLRLGAPGLESLVAFSTGGHKGLLAPQGLGLLWTAPWLRQALLPPGGWLSVEGATDFDRPSTDFQRGWYLDGRRLEQGVPNLLGCAALAESLRVINQAGAEAIARHVDALQAALLDRLAALPAWAAEARRLEALRRAGRLGAILALHHEGRGNEGLQRILHEGFARGIQASVREGYLRLAFHGWHGREDLERVLEWLAAIQ